MNVTRLCTGIDLVEISRIERLTPAIRKRFLLRILTEEEARISGRSWESIAGRFAAKEAVIKALGCGIGPVQWKEIEILQGENGEPVLILHGQARQMAEDHGLRTWSVSISHSRSHAVAMAVALG